MTNQETQTNESFAPELDGVIVNLDDPVDNQEVRQSEVNVPEPPVQSQQSNEDKVKEALETLRAAGWNPGVADAPPTQAQAPQAPAQETASYDDLEDLLYSDPKKAFAILEERAEARATERLGQRFNELEETINSSVKPSLVLAVEEAVKKTVPGLSDEALGAFRATIAGADVASLRQAASNPAEAAVIAKAIQFDLLQSQQQLAKPQPPAGVSSAPAPNTAQPAGRTVRMTAEDKRLMDQWLADPRVGNTPENRRIWLTENGYEV